MRQVLKMKQAAQVIQVLVQVEVAVVGVSLDLLQHHEKESRTLSAKAHHLSLLA